MIKKTRKDFLLKILKIFSSLYLISATSYSENISAQSKSFPLPEGEVPVQENDVTANALGFHHDAKKTDFNLYPDRKKASSKNQICSSCAQYTKVNEGWGKCTILNKGLVNSNGWCSAYSKKS